MTKTQSGHFFEDYRVGQRFTHAVPRTLGEGDRALYIALYPNRFALTSSDAFARTCGLRQSPIDALAVFHTVFGKTVPDISLNAVANLGYAEVVLLEPVFCGDTITATTEVIGLRETSSGQNGVVWVRSRGWNQQAREIARFCRWVMVRKRDPQAPSPETVVPDLAPAIDASDLAVPEGLDFTTYDFALAGAPHRCADYTPGERIDHLDRTTIEEAEHMLATRLWQNTARVHFDTGARDDGRRLIYGGHVMSLARALTFNGLANAQILAGINAGTHANPCFAGDTVSAWSEVLERASTKAPGVGALRLRTVAVRAGAEAFALRDPAGRYLPDVLLDMDYWVLMPG